MYFSATFMRQVVALDILHIPRTSVTLVHPPWHSILKILHITHFCMLHSYQSWCSRSSTFFQNFYTDTRVVVMNIPHIPRTFMALVQPPWGTVFWKFCTSVILKILHISKTFMTSVHGPGILCHSSFTPMHCCDYHDTVNMFHASIICFLFLFSFYLSLFFVHNLFLYLTQYIYMIQ